jgi:hypothetical protein
MAKTSNARAPRATVPTYIIYNAKTGAILQRHRSFCAQTDAYIECDEKALLKQFRDDDDLLDLVGSKDDIAILRADLPETLRSTRGFRVDPRKRALIARDRIVLTPERTEIEGDGSDNIRIVLHIENPKGDQSTSFNGQVKISVSRGKISARKGIVDVSKGRAEFTLTSVAETADRVSLRATAVDGSLSPAIITVAFV